MAYARKKYRYLLIISGINISKAEKYTVLRLRSAVNLPLPIWDLQQWRS